MMVVVNHVGRKTVAQNARISLETMQRIDGRYNTPGINELVASFQRIEDNAGWTATQALQDHFDAMTRIANNGSDLALIKQEASLFRNCESMLTYLMKIEGAGFQVRR